MYYALENYQKALKKEPNNIDYLKNRAQCFYDLKKYEEATKDLEKALTFNITDS